MSAGLIACLLIAFSIWQKNVLFAILIPMLIAMYISFHHDEDRYVLFTLSDEGITIDETYYPYTSLSYFWIDTDNDQLYLQSKQGYKPPFRVPFPEDVDVQKEVGEMLEKHIKKSPHHTGEPLSVTLERIFKL